MWLKLVRINLLLVLFLVCYSCLKEKYPKMKTGYYDVTEVLIDENGNKDTLNFKAVGSLYKPKGDYYSFKGNLNNRLYGNNFSLVEKNSQTGIQYLYYFSETVNFKILNFSITPEKLYVERVAKDTVLTSLITFQYIE